SSSPISKLVVNFETAFLPNDSGFSSLKIRGRFMPITVRQLYPLGRRGIKNQWRMEPPQVGEFAYHFCAAVVPISRQVLQIPVKKIIINPKLFCFNQSRPRSDHQ